LDNQISTLGFSAVGRSPGFFVTVEVTSASDFKVHKITV